MSLRKSLNDRIERQAALATQIDKLKERIRAAASVVLENPWLSTDDLMGWSHEPFEPPEGEVVVDRSQVFGSRSRKNATNDGAHPIDRCPRSVMGGTTSIFDTLIRLARQIR